MLPLQTTQNLIHLIDEAVTSLDQIEISPIVVEDAETKNSKFGEPREKVQKLYESVEKDYPKESDHVGKILCWAKHIKNHYQSSWFLIEWGAKEQQLKGKINKYRDYLKSLKLKIDPTYHGENPGKSPIDESYRSNSTDAAVS